MGVAAAVDWESATAVVAAVDKENGGLGEWGIRRMGVAAAVDREGPRAECGLGTPQKMAY